MDEWTTEQWQACAVSLWGILDDIDTLSDMLKPSDEKGYRKFYAMALKRAEKRHALLHSDGYEVAQRRLRAHAPRRCEDWQR